MEYGVCSEKGKTLQTSILTVLDGGRLPLQQICLQGLGTSTLKADDQYCSSKWLKPLQAHSLKITLKIFVCFDFWKANTLKNLFQK